MNSKLAKIICKACTLILILGLVSCEQDKGLEKKVSGIGINGDAVAGDKLYSQGSNMSLWVNGTTGEIRVSDMNQKTVWSSYPYFEDGMSDFADEGRTKAILAINEIDSYNNIKYLSSYDYSVKLGGLSLKKIQNGVIMIFNFPEQSERFTIPIKLYLDDNSLNVEVLSDKIKTYGDSTINTIDILPYFGAATKEDDGYFLVPDGSGAIIDFKNSNVEAQPYRQDLYGYDSTLTPIQKFDNSETARLPVMGVNKNNKGFVSIATQGASSLAVSATQPNKLSIFGNICFSYNYTPGDTYIIAEKDINSQTVYKRSPKSSSVNPKIKYLFLNDKSDYISMAKSLREFLADNGLKKRASNNPPLYLEIYGGVQKKESFFGIPYNKMCIGTNFNQVKDILVKLNSNEVNNISVFMYGFNKNGMYGECNDLYNFDKSVGGIKGYREINKYADDKSIDLYFSQQVMTKYDGSLKNSAKMISGDTARFGKRNLMNGEIEKNQKWIYNSSKGILLKLDEIIRLKEEKHQNNIYISDIGDYIYGDYNKNNSFLRDENEIRIINELKKAEEVSIRGGNLYAACFAKNIIGTPTQASKYMIETSSVPFYALVMHGFSNISGEVLNESRDTYKSFLDSISLGYSLDYKLTYESSYIFKDTELNDLLSTQYSKWETEIVDFYKKAQVLNGLGDQFITDYVYSDDIAKTVYENNTVVYVNYGNTEKIFDGIKLAARDFKCVRGAIK